jgi:transcriptional regulator with GAF, ATPase, and Fis domain
MPAEDASSETVPSSSAEPAAAAYAMLLPSEGSFRCVPLPAEGSVLVGREEGLDLTIAHASVSRRHARIHGGAPPRIEDLGSTNGTRVMKRRLAPGEIAPLSAGTVVEIGDILALVQRGRGAEPGVPARAGAGARRSAVALRDPRMGEIYSLAGVIGQSPLPLLILGETGVGKDVYAAAVHTASARSGRPLLRLNCAALPESILEGELFGYEKGAFTGAGHAKPGLLEAADGGAVFLDEVGELTLATQAKLLRVLEDGEFLRLGSVKPRRIDIRILAATNRDLQVMAREGTFRADLYYRLAGVEVEIPPLRQRPDDIDVLADHFVEAACAALGRRAAVLSDAARDKLRRYPWPGNIRELRNAIERAVLFSTGACIGPEHIALSDGAAEREEESTPPPATQRSPLLISAMPTPVPARPPADVPAQEAPGPATQNFYSEKRRAERQAILDALERCSGNRSRAAALLGMPRRTFVKRLGEYGIDRPRKKSRPRQGG